METRFLASLDLEVRVLAEIAKALEQVDFHTRQRALAWALSRYGLPDLAADVINARPTVANASMDEEPF